MSQPANFHSSFTIASQIIIIAMLACHVMHPIVQSCSCYVDGAAGSVGSQLSARVCWCWGLQENGLQATLSCFLQAGVEGDQHVSCRLVSKAVTMVPAGLCQGNCCVSCRLVPKTVIIISCKLVSQVAADLLTAQLACERACHTASALLACCAGLAHPCLLHGSRVD